VCVCAALQHIRESEGERERESERARESEKERARERTRERARAGQTAEEVCVCVLWKPIPTTQTISQPQLITTDT
jgi:hypothetical protein